MYTKILTLLLARPKFGIRNLKPNVQTSEFVLPTANKAAKLITSVC